MDGEPVLEHFEGEVRERDAIWKAHPDSAPRLRVQKHRDGSITRILIRSNGRRFEQNGIPVRIKGVTVWFSEEEWNLIERAVLAGLGLGRIE
jgi:hypothetical protein